MSQTRAITKFSGAFALTSNIGKIDLRPCFRAWLRNNPHQLYLEAMLNRRVQTQPVTRTCRPACRTYPPCPMSCFTGPLLGLLHPGAEAHGYDSAHRAGLGRIFFRLLQSPPWVARGRRPLFYMRAAIARTIAGEILRAANSPEANYLNMCPRPPWESSLPNPRNPLLIR